MRINKFVSILLASSLLAGCGGLSLPSASAPSAAGQGTAPAQQASGGLKETAVQVEATGAAKLMNTLKTTEVGGMFTIDIPAGWSVTTGGSDMFMWIRAYDPDTPNLQVFAELKSGYFLKNQQAKNYYQNAYSMTGNQLLYGPAANLPLLVPATLENFYNNYTQYIEYLAQWEPTFAGFDYPLIENFEVIERFPVTNELSSIALDNMMLHGSFTDPLSKEKGEGMFSGTVVDLISMMDPGFDCGFYTIYNLNGVSAPYGMLGEYSALLERVLGSIQYTQAYIDLVAQNQQISMENARIISQMTAATSQTIMDGWNSRQKTYDILSQEYSDATLGYDRYLDTETNEVYKAELGIMDGYDGTRYQKIDQGSSYYTEPVAGYIVSR